MGGVLQAARLVSDDLVWGGTHTHTHINQTAEKLDTFTSRESVCPSVWGGGSFTVPIKSLPCVY